jgi:hypothetical protein
MNPYNTLDKLSSDTVDFVPPAADVVRLYQLAVWKNRLDRRYSSGGESPMVESSERVES